MEEMVYLKKSTVFLNEPLFSIQKSFNPSRNINI